MRLVQVNIENFRGYSQETAINIDPLTVLIGRNDAGKSTILDALDIFFNDNAIEKDDCCVLTDSSEVKISCVFDDLPADLVLDEQYSTTLQNEYLLRSDGLLEIIRTFNCSAVKGKPSGVFAKANHPATPHYNDILTLKNRDLKKRATDLGVDLSSANQSVNSQLRQAIWQHCADLNLTECLIDLSSETGKKVWEQLQLNIPVFAVFKSDRASTDQDAEVQDPMKAAIKEAIRNHESVLNTVISDIRTELEHVATKTVEKIAEMNAELASQLTPQVKNKNWDSLFSVSLTGDDDIPINKRGSGTRRLVLLNFFRAKAEETSNQRGSGIIYAIEEPETSQHPNHQIMLLEAFEDLVAQGQCQIILTTHTPTLARRVSQDSLRLICRESGAPRVYNATDDAVMGRIKDTLGVLPDHDVKVFFGVEGKHDIEFLKRISVMLSSVEPDIPNLVDAERSGKLVFVPLGGSSLELWVSRLAHLGRPEYYLTDRDVPPPASPKYQNFIDQWTLRGCTAWVTSMRELENYIHCSLLTVHAPGYSGTGDDFDDVPMLFAEAIHSAVPEAPAWDSVPIMKKKQKASLAKRTLNTVCVDQMTPDLLNQSDVNDNIRTWLRSVGRELNN